MWLNARFESAHLLLDLSQCHLSHLSDDRFVTLNYPHVRYWMVFDTTDEARSAVEQIRKGLVDGQVVMDREQFAGFNVEWHWHDLKLDEHNYPPLLAEEEEAGEREEWEERRRRENEELQDKPPVDPSLRSLWDMVEPIRETFHPGQLTVENMVLAVCHDRWLSTAELAAIFNKSHNSVRVHFIEPMVKAGKLIKMYPKPHPKQRYKTAVPYTSTNRETVHEVLDGQ
jgi:hypothetical protein